MEILALALVVVALILAVIGFSLAHARINAAAIIALAVALLLTFGDKLVK